MRPSIVKARIADPAYSITYPVPPAVPIFPMMARTMSFAEQRFESVPSTLISMVLGLVWTKHCVANTCSTSLVPIPNAKAPNAPCVEVCESPHTIVIPGKVKPCFGSDNMHDALPDIVHAEQGDAEGAAIVFERVDLCRTDGVGDRQTTVGRRHIVIRHRKDRGRSSRTASRSGAPQRPAAR